MLTHFTPPLPARLAGRDLAVLPAWPAAGVTSSYLVRGRAGGQRVSAGSARGPRGSAQAGERGALSRTQVTHRPHTHSSLAPPLRTAQTHTITDTHSNHTQLSGSQTQLTPAPQRGRAHCRGSGAARGARAASSPPGRDFAATPFVLGLPRRSRPQPRAPPPGSRPRRSWARAAGSMARLGLCLLLSLLLLLRPPAAPAQEEASCHGAFDLYFVLDR